MLKLIAAATASAAMLGLAACGSAEKAGESIDNQIEETTQGERNLDDGAFERAGEGLDEVTGQTREGDAADALNDAADNDARTNP